MKLILAIMSNDDSPAVSSALTKENYQDYIEEFRRSVMECDFKEVFLGSS